MPDVKDAADKGKGTLTRKVGPLPLWGWAVAGVAAVVVVKKVTGGGGGAGALTVPIASIGSGAAGNPPVVSPNQNVVGGTDTATGSAAPPWWATAPAWWNATPSVPLTGQPSTNGSAGAGPATTTPTGAAPKTSWFSKLLNPAGNVPAGASVTTVGGTVYSLSSAALARAGIPGASVPTAQATAATGTTNAGVGSGGPGTKVGVAFGPQGPDQ